MNNCNDILKKILNICAVVAKKILEYIGYEPQQTQVSQVRVRHSKYVLNMLDIGLLFGLCIYSCCQIKSKAAVIFSINAITYFRTLLVHIIESLDLRNQYEDNNGKKAALKTKTAHEMKLIIGSVIFIISLIPYIVYSDETMKIPFAVFFSIIFLIWIFIDNSITVLARMFDYTIKI